MSNDKLNPTEPIPAITKKEYFRAIEAANDTNELFAFIEEKLGEHFLKSGESWVESATRLEEEGRTDAAEILKAAESRWFELGS